MKIKVNENYSVRIHCQVEIPKEEPTGNVFLTFEEAKDYAEKNGGTAENIRFVYAVIDQYGETPENFEESYATPEEAVAAILQQ